MISSANISPSFGKSRMDTLQEVKRQRLMNTKERFGAQASVLLGYSAGVAAINKYTKGKSFTWNKSINTTINDFAAKLPERYGLNYVKDAAKKLSKTSGRQKLIGAATIAAAAVFVAVTNKFAKKGGKLEYEQRILEGKKPY